LASRLLAANLTVLRTSYAVLTTPITTATLATWSGTAGMTAKTAAARTLTGSLGLLTGGVKAFGAALWAMPWAAAAAGIGLVTAAIVKWRENAAAAGLQAEATGAQQDVITRAVERGADATITYAEALKFNEAWYRKLLATG